jgi:hypothetical protein
MAIQPLLKPVKQPDLENRCDTLASRYYKRKTPHCEAYGKSSIRCGGRLEWAHIISRRNRRLRYEPYNHVILCHYHHDYWTRNPFEWVRWVQVTFPNRWRLVRAHRNEWFDGDYQRWIDWFSSN